MKKQRRLIVTISICLFVVAGFAGCSGGSTTPNPVRLNEPAGLVFDEELLALYWNSVEHASGYKIEVKFHDEGLQTIQTAANSYIFSAGIFIGKQGTFDFYIKAVGSGNYTDSNEALISFDRFMPTLARPTNVDFDRSAGILSWDDVTGADYYVRLFQNFSFWNTTLDLGEKPGFSRFFTSLF